MKTNYVFLADGFEEIEALATVDVLRRAGMDVITVSINKHGTSEGAHEVSVNADISLEEPENADWLIFPGGMPGASNLASCRQLVDILLRHVKAGGRVAAICASPAIVLAPLGLLDGKKATCYPSMEYRDCDAEWVDDMVVTDGNIVTGRGPAAAVDFALEIVRLTCGAAKADEVAAGMLLK